MSSKEKGGKVFRFFGGDRKCTDGSCYFCVEWDLNIVGKFTI
jgi:hypothetical protein